MRQANIYHLRQKGYQDPSDPIFFGKAVVHVGSRFSHHGRLNPGTTWVVNRIWTMTWQRNQMVRSNVANVRTLKDVLELRCEDTGEWKLLCFQYMSYSAIWRLVA